MMDSTALLAAASNFGYMYGHDFAAPMLFLNSIAILTITIDSTVA
jgi:hypothetical protein